MGVGDKSGLFQIQRAGLVDIFVIDIDGDDFGQKHIVRAERADFQHLAFQRDRAFGNLRRFDFCAGFRG